MQRSLGALLEAAGMGSTEGEVYSAGVDYIRHTMTPSEVEDAGGGDKLWLSGLESAGVRREALQLRPVSMVGFGGYAAGPVAMLTSANGRLMLQVSGGAAHAYVLACGAWGGCSRLDIQVTVRVPGDVDEAIVRVYRNISELGPPERGRGRVPECRLVYDRAATVYVGRRSRSGVLMRIYNAGAVHGDKDPGTVGCVRAEIEATGRHASVSRETLLDRGWEVEACLEMVGSELRRNGSRLGWRATTAGAVLRRPVKERTDIERKMAWLRQQVMPTVRYLLAQGVARGDIATALGLERSAGSAGDEEWHHPA